jgi:lysophospholipase L1-like esterase
VTGTVTGLIGGQSVELRNNDTDSQTLGADGPFVFSDRSKGEAYDITATGNPESVSCAVVNGAGQINRSDVTNVEVTCSSAPAVTYSVGGTVSGLAGGSVTLQNNGTDDLVLGSNDVFTFPTELSEGTDFNVTVAAEPAGQSCAVANGSGTISGGDVTNVGVNCQASSVTASRLEGAGDSIMRGYNASCTGNTGFFDLFCYSGGDQNQNSFHDGSSSGVTSLLGRYVSQNPAFSGGKSASASGSEMTDASKNNFATQAATIVAAATQPLVVMVELGGNDLCNRTSDADLYTAQQWREAVTAGLQTLTDGLPDGSTVYLSSVPRVQDLRSVGLAKQAGDGGVNCESFWQSFDVCTIATSTDAYTSALESKQQAYNQILAEEAAAFNAMAAQTGVEVVAEYQAVIDNGATLAVGNYSFSPDEINGGDCFHPSISGQNKLAEILWNNNPFK